MTINDYFKAYGTVSETPNFNIQNNYYNDYIRTNELNQIKSSKSPWFYIFLSLFVIITFLSNPKKEEHRDELKIKLNGIVEEMLAEKTDNLVYIGLGKSISNLIIDETLKNVSTDNYLFFSLTKFNYKTEYKIIGFGVFGKVYISDKINKKMIENYSEQLRSKYQR